MTNRKVTCALASVLISSTVAVEAAEEEGQREIEPDHQSAISQRLELESILDANPFALTPYKPTYLLPLAYSSGPPGAAADGGDMDELEMKFQVSLKVPITRRLFGSRTQFAFGYTQVAYWQAYNSGESSPFRETNYEPELMLIYPHETRLGPLTSRIVRLGISHQSNGRSGINSRSWNRIYADFVLESGDWYFSFKPWWRIPEPEKESPDDTSGDDNPDIEDYLGNFELNALRYQGNQTYGLMLRNNLQGEDNRGALQLDWTFPIGEQMRGYTQIFTGYGESLIDYDRYSNRISVGVMLTNWL